VGHHGSKTLVFVAHDFQNAENVPIVHKSGSRDGTWCDVNESIVSIESDATARDCNVGHFGAFDVLMALAMLKPSSFPVQNRPKFYFLSSHVRSYSQLGFHPLWH
jgi:hypothetical protein